MADRLGAAIALLAALALAGCGGSAARNEAAATNASSAAAEVSPQPAAHAPAPALLAKYAGHYPFDVVDGVSFLDRAEVKTAVAALVPATDIRTHVLGGDGPGTPIAIKDGALVAWGCETHNCGGHDWTVRIAPDGRDAQVCYHDAAAMHDRSRWYLAPGRTEMRDGDCPSGA